MKVLGGVGHVFAKQIMRLGLPSLPSFQEGSDKKSHQTKSRLGEGGADLADVLKITRFENDTQIASVDVRALVGSFVMYRRDVSAEVGDDARHVLELSGLVNQLDHELAGSA